MRWLVLIFAASITGLRAQETASVDWPEVAIHGEKPAGLSLTISVPKDHFYQGEVIPVTFTFANTSTAPFYLWIGNYDRSGRIPDIRLAARDAVGKAVVDPLAWYFKMGGGMGGGMGSDQNLGTWAITLAANQWLRFDQPGEYTIVGWSNRPQKGEKDSNRGISAAPIRIELASNPVHLTIDPLLPERAAKMVEDCRVALDAGKNAEITASTSTTERAAIMARREAAASCFTTLRYLNTPAARAELRRLLSWPNSFEAAAGILSAPDPAAEAPLLLDDVQSGRIKLDAETIWIYSALKSYPPPDEPAADEATARTELQKYTEAQRAAREEILAVAESAGGKNGGPNLDAIWAAYQTNSDAAAWTAVVRHQLEFAPEIQRQLLQMAASEQPDPRYPPADLLPLIRRDAPAPNYSREALTALAKIRPDEAKKLIVDDVAGGTFHYRKNAQGYQDSSKALLALPRGMVPELQAPLRKLLAGDRDLEIVFELVDSYGAPDLLPDMLRAYQPHAGKWECEIQGAALRFWIRCDEKAGLDALRQALQSRAETGCYRRALQDVLLPQWTPAAQPLVLSALHDPEKEVVRSAIEVLEKYGDPNCADALVAAVVSDSNRGFINNLLSDTRWTWTAAQRAALQKASSP